MGELNQGRTTGRSVVLSARFTPKEHKEVESIADECRVKIGDYLRQCALHGYAHHVTIDPVATEQWQELARLAANLNQLQRSIHQGHVPDGHRLNALLAALNATLSEVRHSLQSPKVEAPF